MCWLCYTFIDQTILYREQEAANVNRHLDAVVEDQEGVDEDGENTALASSSSSEGDLELPVASGSSPQSPSKSHNQPSKPAVPRQRPVIPPRPKDTSTTSSEGLEPTPFDLPPDPFQELESKEKKMEEEQKQSSPATAPKPTRPPTTKKPKDEMTEQPNGSLSVGEKPVPMKRRQPSQKQDSPPAPGSQPAAESAKKVPPQRPSKPPPARPPPPKRT